MSRYYRSILNVQGGAPAFVPTDIAGCQLWLDAADSSTISIGTGVSQINNKGGLGGNFAQGTGSAQPAYIIAELNGKNIIRFDGNDFLVGSLSAASYNYWHQDVRTDFIVIKIGTVANPNTLYAIVANAILTNPHGSGIAYDDRSSISRNNMFLHVNSAGNASVYNTSNIPNDSYSPQLWNFIKIFADPKNATASERSNIVVDAVSYKTNTATLAASTSNATHPIRIGGFPDLSGFNLVGDLAEIISYDRILTAEEIAQVEIYLTEKWAI